MFCSGSGNCAGPVPNVCDIRRWPTMGGANLRPPGTAFLINCAVNDKVGLRNTTSFVTGFIFTTASA